MEKYCRGKARETSVRTGGVNWCRLALVAGVLLMATPVAAIAAGQCTANDEAVYQARLNGAAASTLEVGILGTVIAVDRVDAGVTYGRAGWQTLKRETPIAIDSLFQIGSQTKMFTSAALQLLAKAGKVSLDAPIDDYIDSSGIPGGKGIIVAQLLNHTSGMGDGIALFDPPAAIPTEAYSYDDMLMFARIYGKAFEPGARWAYNNTAYHVAGHIAEKVGGKPLSRYLRKKVFGPLGMTETFVGAQESWPVKRMAHGYAYDPATGGTVDTTRPPSLNWAGPAGDMVSSIGDMLIWMRAISHAGGDFPLSLEDFRRYAVEPGLPGAPEIYGLGMSEMNVAGLRMWGHGGYIHGYVSLSLYDPESGAIVVMFSTLPGDKDEDFRSIKDAMMVAMAGAIHGLPQCAGGS